MTTVETDDVKISPDDVTAARVAIERRKRALASSKVRQLEDAYENASEEEAIDAFDQVQRAILQVMEMLEERDGVPPKMGDLTDVLCEMGMNNPAGFLPYMMGLGSISHPGKGYRIKIRGFVSSRHLITQ